MNYQIKIKPSAQKDLDKLPVNELTRIISRLQQLAVNPRPVGIQKLSHYEGYRVRSGKYRILFIIDDNSKAVEIYRVKHRKDVYK